MWHATYRCSKNFDIFVSDKFPTDTFRCRLRFWFDVAKNLWWFSWTNVSAYFNFNRPHSKVIHSLDKCIPKKYWLLTFKFVEQFPALNRFDAHPFSSVNVAIDTADQLAKSHMYFIFPFSPVTYVTSSNFGFFGSDIISIWVLVWSDFSRLKGFFSLYCYVLKHTHAHHSFKIA